jgi:hypothetical protein
MVELARRLPTVFKKALPHAPIVRTTLEGAMTRFALYSAANDAPRRRPWPLLRILAWLCLWSAMLFWAWVFLAVRA